MQTTNVNIDRVSDIRARVQYVVNRLDKTKSSLQSMESFESLESLESLDIVLANVAYVEAAICVIMARCPELENLPRILEEESNAIMDDIDTNNAFAIVNAVMWANEQLHSILECEIVECIRSIKTCEEALNIGLSELLSSETECKICYSLPVGFNVVPCDHKLCGDCAFRQSCCPFCRTIIHCRQALV